MRHIKNLIRLLSFFGLIVSASYSGAGEPTVQLSETINEFVQILASTPASELRTKGTTKANSQVFSSAAFGVLKLTLSAASYSWQFIPIAGQSFSDSGSASCH